jgi:hypothetical protein
LLWTRPLCSKNHVAELIELLRAEQHHIACLLGAFIMLSEEARIDKRIFGSLFCFGHAHSISDYSRSFESFQKQSNTTSSSFSLLCTSSKELHERKATVMSWIVDHVQFLTDHGLECVIIWGEENTMNRPRLDFRNLLKTRIRETILILRRSLDF